MKALILTAAIIFSASTYGQQPTPTKYYFIQMRVTGKGAVELSAENGVNYSDISNVLVSRYDTTKKGVVPVPRRYDSYSEAFNALSGAGLKFVQYVTLKEYGGATAALVGDVLSSYAIWTKVE